jgi:hypothetical protein
MISSLGGAADSYLLDFDRAVWSVSISLKLAFARQEEAPCAVDFERPWARGPSSAIGRHGVLGKKK